MKCGKSHPSSSEPLKTVQSDDHEAGPSDSTLSLTLMPSWIKDEDNREEHPSSFNKLDAYSPQLICSTKRRADRPGTRGRKRPKLRNKIPMDITEEWMVQSTTGTAGQGKMLPSAFAKGLRHTVSTINESNKPEVKSPVTTRDKVSNLRAQFEQMSAENGINKFPSLHK